MGERDAAANPRSENEIAHIIVDVAWHVHRTLGPGLLESAYEAVLAHELESRGLHVQRQCGIPIVWKGVAFDEGFRADLIVDGRVIVEVKSVVGQARVLEPVSLEHP